MLLIDHYQGTHGPIIWLQTDSTPDLTKLGEIFRALAQGGAEVELCSAMAASRVVNLSALRLRLDRSRRPRRMRLVRASRYERPSAREGASHGPLPPSLEWWESPSGWRRRAAIVDKLLRLRRSDAAHRDLTTEGVDDALVELSFRQVR